MALVDSGYWTGYGNLNDDQLVGFNDIYGSGTYDDFSSPIVGIDEEGHGTSMAGIIVGSGDGGSNPKGRVFRCGNSGSGNCRCCNTDNLQQHSFCIKLENTHVLLMISLKQVETKFPLETIFPVME